MGVCFLKIGLSFYRKSEFVFLKIGVCFFENRNLFLLKIKGFFLENRSLFLKMGVWFLEIGLCLLRKSEFVLWKSEYWPQILFCLLLLSRNKISGGSRGGARGIRPPPLLLKNRSMFSRCCINFAHELSCQILTNHSIKIGRRAWPTRDHGEQSQKQLSSLPVIAGWIFASEVSLKSKF